MKVYLVRHTSVDVAPGTCYGQTDVPLRASFQEEAEACKKALQDTEMHFHVSIPVLCPAVHAWRPIAAFPKRNVTSG